MDLIAVPSSLGVNSRVKDVKVHQDHIIPRTHGGTDDPSNLRWLCWFCNLARTSMSITFDSAVSDAGKAFWSALRAIKGDS